MSEPSANVEYRDIPGFTGYRVGSDGSIWSMKSRKDPNATRAGNWQRLKLTQRKSGYITACFRIGKKNYVRYVHHLVLEAFVGPRPDGMECCHGIGGASDNSVENLRWGTKAENFADKRLHGTRLFGSRNWNAKLTERDIPLIRALAGEGVEQSIIAHAWGIGNSTVQEIVNRSRWKDVEDV